MKKGKPKCNLVGTDGNVFGLIGTVCRVLRSAGQVERAREFGTLAMQQHSYGAVLRLCCEYVSAH